MAPKSELVNHPTLPSNMLKGVAEFFFEVNQETVEIKIDEEFSIKLKEDSTKTVKKKAKWSTEEKDYIRMLLEDLLQKKEGSVHVTDTPFPGVKPSKKLAYHKRHVVLAKIYKAITNSSKPERIAEIILNDISKIVKNDLAAVGLFFNNKKNIRLFSCRDNSHFLEKGEVFNNAFTENVMKLTQGKVLVVNDLLKEDEATGVAKKMRDHGLRSHISIPLISGNEVYGIMTIGSKIPKYFDREKQGIIIELASQLAISLRQAQLQKQISEQNIALEKRVMERTRQLGRANKELESFSYSVSHDLQTPVRAINGFSNILKEEYREKLDVEGIRILDNIIQNTAQMNNLINDLLTLTQISQVKMTSDLVNLNSVVAECLMNSGVATSDRDIVWKIGELPQISADRILIKKLFINLISNAIKFTKLKKKAIIEIGLENTVDGHVFFVRDNGVGFDMKYSNKLFEVFQRLHDQKEYQGTGVGLAIVRQIIEKFDGKVWADSKPGLGTTIYFNFFHSK